MTRLAILALLMLPGCDKAAHFGVFDPLDIIAAVAGGCLPLDV